MAVCNMDCFNCIHPDCIKGGLPTKEETARGRAAWPTFEAAREAERRFLHRFNFTPAEIKRMREAANRDGAVFEVVKRKPPGRPKKQLTEAEIQAKKEHKKTYNHNYWIRKKEEANA